MFRIQQEMWTKSLNGIHVTPVDNYQGEENEIILLSLVRSNPEGRIGYLKVENRVCVALSRAKKGFYAIGNMKQLAEGSVLWNRIVGDFRKENKVGEALPLACQNHPDTVTLAKSVADFSKVSDGGCDLPCEARLECGHVCTRKCHPTDRDHSEYKCKKPCVKTLCELNHVCPKLCSEECDPCLTVVEKQMPGCQHWQAMTCCQDPEKVPCEILVPDRAWPCGHTYSIQCQFTPDNYSCTLKTEKEMPDCHHLQTMLCNQDPAEVPCRFVIPDRDWPCGHVISVQCQYTPENYPCHVEVQKTLPCGHVRVFTCSTSTDGYHCQEMVKIECPKGHKSMIRCCVRVDFKCEHQSTVICLNDERHEYPVVCHNANMVKCPRACQEVLPCGHQCSGSCGDCNASGSHIPCNTVCQKPLACKHVCQHPCSTLCQPCPSPCIVMCGHGECTNQCGGKCDPCDKPCLWKCKHLKCTKKCPEQCDRPPCNARCPLKLWCGHGCPGPCGEPCPPMCRICQAGSYKQLLQKLGGRFDGDSLFVVLKPCNHTVEVRHMDRMIWEAGAAEQLLYPRAVRLHACPLCNSVISYCPRYGNEIKVALRELDAVKRHVHFLHQSTAKVEAILKGSAPKEAKQLALKLSDRMWMEDNLGLVQMVAGCCTILPEILLGGLIAIPSIPCSDLCQFVKNGDVDGMKKVSVTFQSVYLKSRITKYLNPWHLLALPREMKNAYGNQQENRLRARRTVMMGLGWIPVVECRKGREDGVDLRAEKEATSDPDWLDDDDAQQQELLALAKRHVDVVSKVTLREEQKSGVADVFIELLCFFNPDLGGFTRRPQETWRMCRRGHAYPTAPSDTPGRGCAKCFLNVHDDDGEWDRTSARSLEDSEEHEITTASLPRPQHLCLEDGSGSVRLDSSTRDSSITYDRAFLLKCRESPLAKTEPRNLPDIPGVTFHDEGEIRGNHPWLRVDTTGYRKPDTRIIYDRAFLLKCRESPLAKIQPRDRTASKPWIEYYY